MGNYQKKKKKETKVYRKCQNFNFVKVSNIMVFKIGQFNKPLKGEVQGFEGWTEVEPKSNRDDVIINLIMI